MSQRFPSNPYDDVEPSEFNKDNKKHASEHFLDENRESIDKKIHPPCYF